MFLAIGAKISSFFQLKTEVWNGYAVSDWPEMIKNKDLITFFQMY